jgi:hypothetical protein
VEKQFSVFTELGYPSGIDAFVVENRLKLGLGYFAAEQSVKEGNEKLADQLVEGARLKNKAIHVEQQLVGEVIVFQLKDISAREGRIQLRPICGHFVAKGRDTSIQAPDTKAQHVHPGCYRNAKLFEWRLGPLLKSFA